MQPSLLDLSPKFHGAEFSVEHDQARLTTQLDRVLTVIQSGEWLTLGEIATRAHAPESSVSAQLRNLRKPQHGAYVIDRQPSGDRSRGLFVYRLRLSGRDV